MLAYLGRYTHRVAIANSRLVGVTDGAVSFRWKDYRHHGKSKLMTLAPGEFIRRFLLHTRPDGFHRIRHYGFLANGHRAGKLARCRALLAAGPPIEPGTSAATACETAGAGLHLCPCCGGTMITLHRFPPTPMRPALVRSFSWYDSS